MARIGKTQIISMNINIVFYVLAFVLIFFATSKILDAKDAQTSVKFSSKPIKIMLPSQAGSSNDRDTRMLIPFLGKHLGTSIFIEYVPGADGVIAHNKFYKEKPDGHSLISFNLQSPLILELTRSTNFITKNYSVIGAWQVKTMGLYVSPDNWNTLSEFLNEAKKRPISMAGTGGATVLNAYLLSTALGIKFNYVPYKSSGECMIAVAGKHVDADLTYTAFPKPMVSAGKLKALLALSSKPDRNLPGVPVMRDFLREDEVVTARSILAAPPNTPKEVITKLATALRKAVEEPEFGRLTESAGITVDFQPASVMIKSIRIQYELLEKYKSYLK